MRKFLRFILPLLLVVGALVAVAVLVTLAQGQRPERKDTSQQAMLIDAIRAQKTSLNFSVLSQGSVRPRTQTTLVAEVAGRIVSVSSNFIAGGFFRSGEMLLQIDPSDYETALLRAEANLAARRAQLADQKARSEQALKDWNNLGRQGEPSDLTLRKPQLAEAEAAVQAAEAELQEAKRDLQRTRIKVPYDGLVRSKAVDVGQYVTPGTPLGVTFSVDTAEVRLPLSSGDIAYLDLPSLRRSRICRSLRCSGREQRPGAEDGYLRARRNPGTAGRRRGHAAALRAAPGRNGPGGQRREPTRNPRRRCRPGRTPQRLPHVRSPGRRMGDHNHDRRTDPGHETGHPGARAAGRRRSRRRGRGRGGR
jgi:biotin carboxyl carrier protein